MRRRQTSNIVINDLEIRRNPPPIAQSARKAKIDLKHIIAIIALIHLNSYLHASFHMHALDHLSAFDVLVDSLINTLHAELDKVLCRSPYYPKATANVDLTQIE
jgi:hypothetical protein